VKKPGAVAGPEVETLANVSPLLGRFDVANLRVIAVMGRCGMSRRRSRGSC
jgi:hypothetical protein